MKNELLLAVSLLISTGLSSNTSETNKVITKAEMVEIINNTTNNSLLEYYKPLLIAMMFQESHYGILPSGDNGMSKGVLHIQDSFIETLNNHTGKHFKPGDQLDPIKSLEMFLAYQEYHNPTRSFEEAAKIWNGGSAYNQYPKICKNATNYWNTIKSHIEQPKGNVLLAVKIIESAKNNT